MSLNLISLLALENMEVWGTPDFKSNSPTVAAACMFHKIHSVGQKKTRYHHDEYICSYLIILG